MTKAPMTTSTTDDTETTTEQFQEQYANLYASHRDWVDEVARTTTLASPRVELPNAKRAKKN